MSKRTPSAKHSLFWRITLSLVLLAVALYVLATHWQTVRSSLQVARGASISWLALSLLLMALTFAIAASIYGALALHRLRYKQTLLVEVATAFVNKLLPSGLGGLGLHGVYLYKRKHTTAEATVVVSINNLLGIAANVFLLGCAGVFYPEVFRQLVDGNRHSVSWQLAAFVLAAIVMVLAWPTVRRRIARFIGNLLTSLRKVSKRSAIKALLLAALLTVAYTTILFSTAHSIGVRLSLLQVFVVFSVGMLAGTATPTPGGLVGAEAGLFAGFVAYGVSSPAAGATVLLYRLVTYWLPLVPGALALLLARRRKLV